ncbi:hypothetical protein HDA32_002607 [Spinactinospora alkalitolerans]|uniref:Uncharacterized protein n=1 Tax=Spinactinospora alkalitolerans TaxID=687207 RepID=A0A852TW01_9ACTN|nr:hypothetical protein [Spinactinospora alkalitolerans]NYE47487.1 hypothetical protein [Spinactinospora alkalitolerans]
MPALAGDGGRTDLSTDRPGHIVRGLSVFYPAQSVDVVGVTSEAEARSGERGEPAPERAERLAE